MARRRELADVADGMTGHFVLHRSWKRDRQFAAVAAALRSSDGNAFAIDIVNGRVMPPSSAVKALTAELGRDLRRHLGARNIPTEWVDAATFRVSVENEAAGRPVITRCMITITDDNGVEHTSTRTAALYMPRSGLFERLSRALRYWSN